MKSKLNKYQRAEFKDLYDGSFQSLKELAGLFKVSVDCMRWYVDYKGYRKRHTARTLKWQAKNPERMQKIRKKAYKVYVRRKKLGLGPILHDYD